MGKENLIPNSERTPEQLREQTRKGGIASGQARKKKKTLQEICQAMMATKVTSEADIKKLQKLYPGLDVSDIDYATAMTYAQVNKALKGDAKAFEVVRDTGGEKPVNKTEHSGQVSLSDMSDEELNIKLEMLMSKQDQ